MWTKQLTNEVGIVLFVLDMSQSQPVLRTRFSCPRSEFDFVSRILDFLEFVLIIHPQSILHKAL